MLPLFYHPVNGVIVVHCSFPHFSFSTSFPMPSLLCDLCGEGCGAEGNRPEEDCRVCKCTKVLCSTCVLKIDASYPQAQCCPFCRDTDGFYQVTGDQSHRLYGFPASFHGIASQRVYVQVPAVAPLMAFRVHNRVAFMTPTKSTLVEDHLMMIVLFDTVKCQYSFRNPDHLEMFENVGGTFLTGATLPNGISLDLNKIITGAAAIFSSRLKERDLLCQRLEDATHDVVQRSFLEACAELVAGAAAEA